MSVFVDDVVGEFKFVEGQRPAHPVLAAGRRVRVNMDLTSYHRLVSLAGDHPAIVLILVTVTVDRDDVQHDDVLNVSL